MQITQKLKNLFFYGGVEKEAFHTLVPDIHEENRVLLGVFSEIAGIMFFLLFIASMLTQGFAAVNSSTYLICGFVMAAITLCVRYLVPKHPALVVLLVYLFEIVLYVFSIRISMLHADKPAVSAVAFLLVTPLLFYDRPVRLCALIVADVVAFCVMVLCQKNPEVVPTDIWNMVTFGIVAVVSTIFIMSIKMRALSQSRQIEYLGHTDLLTGLKNRNYYENRLEKYPKLCRSGLICVYADVNGLHEVNNSQGHQAGDRMLREVAEAMQRTFGPEDTYRVGGDEFVAFCVNARPEAVSADLDRLRHELSEKGYHVSFGTAAHGKEQGPINMQELVKEAENAMFSEKREYYRQPDHNRRNR